MFIMQLEMLESAGFTKGELKVYSALLDLGETTSGPIIAKSGISSSKVYEILEKLSKKGLVSHIVKNKTKYFQPADPQRILDYLDKEKTILEKTRNKAEKLVKTLSAKQKVFSEQQSSSLYEGFEGIKSVFISILNTLKKGEEYYVFTVKEEASSNELRLFFIQHHQKRVKKGIKVKLLSDIRFKSKIQSMYPNYKLLLVSQRNLHPEL